MELADRLAPLLGVMGAVSSIALSASGAANGTFKCGEALSAISVTHPKQVMKCMVTVVIAGVLGLYGITDAVLISSRMGCPTTAWGQCSYKFADGCAHLASGLSVGLACLVAGRAIGHIGVAGIKATVAGHHGRSGPGSDLDVPLLGGGHGDAQPGQSAQQPQQANAQAQEGYGQQHGYAVKPAQQRHYNGTAYVVMVLNLIFAEALGLYGLIVGLCFLGQPGQQK